MLPALEFGHFLHVFVVHFVVHFVGYFVGCFVENRVRRQQEMNRAMGCPLYVAVEQLTDAVFLPLRCWGSKRAAVISNQRTVIGGQ